MKVAIPTIKLILWILTQRAKTRILQDQLQQQQQQDGILVWYLQINAHSTLAKYAPDAADYGNTVC